MACRHRVSRGVRRLRALLQMGAVFTVGVSLSTASAQQPSSWASDEYVSMTTGAATLEIPIEVPKGTGGFEPELALRYSSHGTDGPFGVGWSLRLGEISRTLRFGTPAYDASDQYELDGELLVHNSSENRYHTATEQFWRIRTVAGAWEVTYPNGNKAWYGRTADSRIIHTPSGTIARWLLSDLDDANGNRIRVQYVSKGDPGTQYPDVITYSYRASTGQPVGGLKRVRFIYEAAQRPDVMHSFPGGVETRLSWRVAEVRSSYQAASGQERPFRRLALRYGSPTGLATQRSRLHETQLYGSDCGLTADLSTCSGQPARQYSYADPSDVIAGSEKQWPPGSAASVFPSSLPYLEAGVGDFDRGKDLGYRFVDVDGDGLVDILRADKQPAGGGPSVHKVFLNIGGRWAESAEWSQRLGELTYASYAFAGNATTLSLQPVTEKVWLNRKPIWDDGPNVDFGAGTAQIVDLDGDGLPDLLVSVEFRVKNRLSSSWNIQTATAAFRNTGDPSEGWVPDANLVSGLPALSMIMGIDSGDSILHGYSTKVTQVSGLRNFDRYFAFPTGGRIVELNGDGRSDVVFAPEPYMAKALSIDHSMACGSAGDVYGGRQHQFMPVLPQGAWLNTDSGWVPAPGFDSPRTTLAVASGIPGDTGVRFVDVNRDGLDDIVKAHVDATDILDVLCGWVPITPFEGSAVYLNTGDGWCDETSCPEATRYRLPAGVTFARRWNPLSPDHGISSYQKFLIDNELRLVDLNADGWVDLLRTDGSVSPTLGLRAWLQDPGSPAVAWVEDARFAPPSEFASNEVQSDQNPINFDMVLSRGVRVIDMDGDGAVDLLRSAQHLANGDELVAMASQGFTDVLRQEENGQGGTVAFTYQGADRDLEVDPFRHFAHLDGLAEQDESTGSTPEGIRRWTRQPVVKEVLRSVEPGQDPWLSRYFFVRPRWCREHRAGLGFRITDVWEAGSAVFLPERRLRRTYTAQQHGIAGLPSRIEILKGWNFVGYPSQESLQWSRVFDRTVLAGDQVPGSTTGVMVPRLLAEAAQYHHADGAGALRRSTYEYDPVYPASFVSVRTIERPTGSLRITRTPWPASVSTWIRGLVGSETQELLGSQTILQRSESYEYDTQGRLTRVDRTIQQRVAGAANEGVATTLLSYDIYGNLSTRTDPDQRVESYCYDGGSGSFCPATETNSFSWLSAVRDKLNGVTSIAIDPGTGNLETLLRFNGDRVRIALDPFGRRSGVFLQPAAASEFLLESWSYVDDMTNPAGQPWIERIEEVGDGSTIRSAAYLDALGRVARAVVDGDRGWTGRAFQRDREGRLQKETNEVACADAACSALSVDQAGVPQQESRYDLLGRLVEVVQPDGSLIQFGFRRAVRSQPPVGPGSGNDVFDAILIRDAEGNFTRQLVDGERVVWIEECHGTAAAAGAGNFWFGTQFHAESCPGSGQASPPTTYYTYDGDGEIASIYDAEAVAGNDYTSASHRLRYVYDTLAELRRIEDPDGGTQTLAYNLQAKSRTWTNAKGETATYLYDDLDRLAEVHPPGYPQSGSPVLIDYDSHTRARERITHGSAYTLEYDYDPLGRLSRKLQTAGGQTLLMDYAYDLLDRPTLIDYPEGTRVRYEYAGPFLRRVCEPATWAGTCSGAAIDYITNVEYDGSGRIERVHSPPGVLEHTYDGTTDRLERMWLQRPGTVLLDQTYAYDFNGRVKSVTDGTGTAPSASATFEYDPRGRLIRHDLGGTDKWFRYDTLGNLVGRDVASSTSPPNLTYAPGFPHRLAQVSAGLPSDGIRTHDLAGNVTRRADQHLTYDWQSRLVCVGTSAGSCNTRRLEYDFDGERLWWGPVSTTHRTFEFGEWMTFETNDWSSVNVGTAQLEVRALGRTIAVKTRTGALLRTADTPLVSVFPRPPPGTGAAAVALLVLALVVFSHRQGFFAGVARRPIPATVSIFVALSLLLPPHQLFAGGGGGSGPLVQWVFSDPIGSGVLVTNSNATSLMRRHFEPFGRVVHETAISGTWPRPQFAGHLDDGIGLYDFRARHYDPDAAQFVQIDPLVPDPYQPADLNPYGYVRNDPLNATDPTGEFVLELGTLGTILYYAVVAYAAYVAVDTTLDATRTEHASLPNVGWLQASVSSLETALPDRSVATRTAATLVEVQRTLEICVEATGTCTSSTESAPPPPPPPGSMDVAVGPFEIVAIGRSLVDVARRLAQTAAREGTRAGTQAAGDAVRVVGRSAGAQEAIFTGRKITNELSEQLGIPRRVLGRAVERIKQASGLRGNENVAIGRATGDVYDPRTGEILGNVFHEVPFIK